MAISVIVCGLVRDQERLKNRLQNYFDWRNEGKIDQIIYSTWINEVDNFTGLRKFLEQNKVQLIEIEEPRLVLKGGHQIHQMIAFFYGLAVIKNRDQFILKTRVDLADNHESMLFDFEHGTPRVNDALNVGLKYQILIEYSQMIYPFLCGDAQFFGHFEDLAKLVNLNTDMELIYNRLAVEQTFFFHPFKNIQLFQEHFYWNIPHISEISNKRDSQIDAILARNEFKSVIESWWYILYHYFKVGWGPLKENRINIDSLEESFRYNKEMKMIGGDLSDVIADQTFINVLYDLIKPKAKEIEIALNPVYFNKPLSYTMDKYEQYLSFSKKFSDLPSPKIPILKNKSEYSYVIRGAAQHFFVKDTNDEASRRYHEQITTLRRENDILKKELNINFTHTFLHRCMNKFMSRKMIESLKYKHPKLTSFYAKHFMKKKG
jgi:hypothetical protein